MWARLHLVVGAILTAARNRDLGALPLVPNVLCETRAQAHTFLDAFLGPLLDMLPTTYLAITTMQDRSPMRKCVGLMYEGVARQNRMFNLDKDAASVD